jgi:hypothetical protein
MKGFDHKYEENPEVATGELKEMVVRGQESATRDDGDVKHWKGSGAGGGNQ